MINLTIPESLILTNQREDHVDFNCIKNKTIIGLCGYSKSGKDFTAKQMQKNYGFHRVSFGDTVKDYMNNHIKKEVYDDLLKNGVEINYDDIDFHVGQGDIKETLRPYMIWFAETIKKLNGAQFWLNETLRQAEKYNKIVISDVRRVNELDLFKCGKSINHNRNELMCAIGDSQLPEDGYDFHLWKINKLSNKDADLLTQETIRVAHDNWYFSDEIRLDPHVSKSHRKLAIDYQIKDKLIKHGIQYNRV